VSRRLCIAALPALLSMACGGGPTLDHISIQPSGYYGQFAIDTSSAALDEGAVLAFQAQPENGAATPVSATVTATVDDETIATLVPTTTPNQWVLVGSTSGTTTLHIQAVGREYDTIAVTVTAQGHP